MSGIAEYDVDKNNIYAPYVKYVDNTLTTLKQDLKNGDTVVYLDNISNWNFKEFPKTPGINRGFIFWNYKDSTGHLYEPETYSRNSWYKLYEFSNVNKQNHTITLNEPWNKGTIKAGTKVSQSMDGNVYNYGLLTDQSKVATSFQTIQNVVHGIQTENGDLTISFDNTKFRPATKYIKFMLYDNFNDQPNTTTEIKDIVIREVAE